MHKRVPTSHGSLPGSAMSTSCCYRTSLYMSIKDLSKSVTELAMQPVEFLNRSTRRELLKRTGMGFGSLALAQLLGGEGLLAPARAAGSVNPLAPKVAHFPAKAKNVIHLFMNGGP